MRIADEDITFVFQGSWSASLHANLSATRRVFPGARFVISSTDRCILDKKYDAEVLFSGDPGPLPPYKLGVRAPMNNVNRQIVSSLVGLMHVRTRYAVKIRTDCSVNSRAFVERYESVLHTFGGGARRLLASSVYTLHPFGLEALPFHVSDWFFFGETAILREYYDVPLMTERDANWYQFSGHEQNSNFFARQYRSRFSPEQYIAVENARKCSYQVPRHIADNEKHVVDSYISFLIDKFVVCDLFRLGLVFEKYQQITRSNFQFFNCLWWSDWHSFARDRLSATVSCLNGADTIGPTHGQRRLAVAMVRHMDAFLGAIKKVGLMPLIGKVLGFFRKLNC